MNADIKKRYREKANRYKRALLKEKEEYGFINDGAGRRYLVGAFYILAGLPEKALEYYSWYQKEFPDDSGEPISFLYWALTEYRNGNIKEANNLLKHTMLSNLYLLPYLFGENINTVDMWHSSNMEYSDYLYDVEEYLNEPTQEERAWFKNEYYSESSSSVREKHIQAFHTLLTETDVMKRSALLRDLAIYNMQYIK